MKTLLAVAVFVALFAVPAVKAQTTHTKCNIDGDEATCTSKSDSDPSFNQNLDQFNNGIQKLSQRMHERAAARSAAKQEILSAKVNVEYCHQNPGGSVTTNDGQLKGCVDEIAYVKAYCEVQKWKGPCGKDWAWIETYKPAANTMPTEMPKAAPEPVVIPTPVAQATPAASTVDAPAQKESLGDIARRYQKTNPNAQISGQ